MVYIRDGIITKRLENLEGKHSEIICLKLTVSKVLSFFRSYFSRIPTNTVQYRKYKTFIKES